MSRFQLNLVSLLVLSIPALLVTGPFLPDLALSVSSIIFLIYIVRNRKFEIFKDYYFFFFLFFYIVITISLLQSKYLEEIFFKNIFYFRFGIFLLLVKYLINTDSKFLENLKNVLLTIFILLFIDSLIQLIIGKNIIGLSPFPGRITSFFGDESILGSYVSRLCPLLVALLYLEKDNKYKIIFVLMMSFIIVILSGERASIALFLIFVSILFFITEYNIKKKILSFLFFIIFVFTTFTVLIKTNDYAKFRIVDTTLSQINLNYKNNKPFYKEVIIDGKSFAIARNDTLLPLQYDLYFDASKKIFLDHLFFGSGPKSFRYLSNEDKYKVTKSHAAFRDMSKDFNYDGYTNLNSRGNHPHNIYLQLFSETGLFGGLYILCIFFYVSLMMFSKINLEKKIILISLFINLFPLITSGNFFNNWLSIIFFYPLGFLYFNKKIN